MVDDSLLEKLRRIKALADDGKSEHECQTALLMFQKLLKKHGLSEKDVPITDEQPEEIKEEKAYNAARVPSWVRHLYVSVAKHFRCVPICTTYGRNHTLNFVGHESDAKIAAAAFSAAYNAAQRMCDEQQANARYFAAHFDTNKCFNRLDYLMGFALGVEAAYSKQEAEGTLDIIVTTPTDVLATTKGIPKNTHHYSASADNAAVSAGFVDGNNVGRGDALPHADGGAFADMPVFNYGA